MELKQTTINNLERALIELDQIQAEKIIFKEIGMSSPIEVTGALISETLNRIGMLWEKGELALSQVFMSSVICEKIIDKVLPPKSPDRIDMPKTAIGVFEDFHMLGKRIIYSTLRASGIELIDLGGGLSIENIVKHVEDKKIKILLLSVLMLPSALKVKDLMDALKTYNVKVIVGGAPFRFDETLVKEVGAHYSGKDSGEALKIVNELMNQN